MSAPVEPRTSRRTEIEALRGIAALGVLVAHAWGLGHGYAPSVFTTWSGRLGLAGGQGLALFFALSGYLLTRPFLNAASRGSRVSLRHYGRHRVARIAPTWLFVVAFMLLVHSDGVPRRQWWRFPFLLQGFWSDTVIRVDGPAWSLAVEAQYYLLLPLLALCLVRRFWVALAALLVLGVATFVLTLVTVSLGTASAVWTYSLPANFVYFVPGMLLALVEVRTGIVSALGGLPHVRLLLLVASVPFWLAFVAVPRAGLGAAAAAGLTIAAVVLPLGEGRVLVALRTRGLFLLGNLSFGIYLWHEPAMRLLQQHGVEGWLPLLAVGLPLTLVLATVSYTLVEAPALRLRDSNLRDLGPDQRDVQLAFSGVVLAASGAALALLTT